MDKQNINPTRKPFETNIAFLHIPQQDLQSLQDKQNDFFNKSQNLNTKNYDELYNSIIDNINILNIPLKGEVILHKILKYSDSSRDLFAEYNKDILISNITEDLLNNGINPNIPWKDEMVTPLHMACKFGLAKTLTTLLDSELTDVDIKDINNRNILHYTVLGGDTKINNNDPSYKIWYKNTLPITYKNIMDKQTSRYINKDIFYILRNHERVDISKLINQKDNLRNTPLNYSIMYLGKKVFKELVNLGADVKSSFPFFKKRYIKFLNENIRENSEYPVIINGYLNNIEDDNEDEKYVTLKEFISFNYPVNLNDTNNRNLELLNEIREINKLKDLKNTNKYYDFLNDLKKGQIDVEHHDQLLKWKYKKWFMFLSSKLDIKHNYFDRLARIISACIDKWYKPLEGYNIDNKLIVYRYLLDKYSNNKDEKEYNFDNYIQNLKNNDKYKKINKNFEEDIKEVSDKIKGLTDCICDYLLFIINREIVLFKYLRILNMFKKNI